MDRYDNKRLLIHSQVKILFSLTPVMKESGSHIKGLPRTINDFISNLDVLKVDTESWDVIFTFLCSTCLPDLTLNLWEQSLRSNSMLPSWRDMDTFLTARFHTPESVADLSSSLLLNTTNKKVPNPRHSDFRVQKKVNLYYMQIADKSKKCTLCEGSHPLRICPVFLKMSVENRIVH